ncbi:MAG: FkbM family methyltransferase [Nitrososphaeria archaeon]
MELLKVESFANRVKVDRARRIVHARFADRTVHFLYRDNLFAETLAWIRTGFFEQQYGWLDVKGRNVVDIGASVGDTAIYFALKGARHVYGFELDRERCALAHENVKLNNLSSKIDIINAGCGNPSKIASDSNKKSRFYSLLQIAEMYGLKDAVLKMDCEGCEYPILLSSSKSTVRRFAQIMLEYHYGYKNIAKRLIECGFDVRYTRPESFKSANGRSYIGYMYARQVKQ